MKKKYIRPLIFGFVAIYLISMSLLTYAMYRYYVSSFENQKYQLLDTMKMYLSSINKDAMDGTELNLELSKEMSYVMNQVIEENANGDCYYTGVVYGPSGKLFSKTGNLFGANGYIYQEKNFTNIHVMEDYLTKEEMEQIADLFVQEQNLDYPFRIDFCYEKSTSTPAMIHISKNLETVFFWKNKNLSDPEDEQNSECFETVYNYALIGNFSFPYLVSDGKTVWEEWNANEKLQNIPDSRLTMIPVAYYNEYYTSGQHNTHNVTTFSMNTDATLSNIEPDMFTLQLFQDCHPLKEAVASLEFIYLYGLLLLIVCILKSSKVTKEVYNKQQQLEDRRNRATEAIASNFTKPIHEIQRHTDHILDQTTSDKSIELDCIIEQTEKMDDMIKHLIKITKEEG